MEKTISKNINEYEIAIKNHNLFKMDLKVICSRRNTVKVSKIMKEIF